MFGSTRLAGGRVIATAFLFLGCQNVAVDVDVDVDLGDEPAASSTGDLPEPEEPADSSSGEAPADSTGDFEPSAVPLCGDGLLEAPEECDAATPNLCELDSLGCVFKRYMFLSSERRTGTAWAADMATADAACRADAAAAGFAAPDSYAAFVPRDGAPVSAGWGSPEVFYRGTCGDRLPIPGSDPQAWRLLSEDDSPDLWPLCSADGSPVEVSIEDSPIAVAWWTFTDESGVVPRICDGGASGGVGHIQNATKLYATWGAYLPCSTALPIVCAARLPL